MISEGVDFLHSSMPCGPIAVKMRTIPHVFQKLAIEPDDLNMSVLVAKVNVNRTCTNGVLRSRQQEKGEQANQAQPSFCRGVWILRLLNVHFTI